LWWPSVVVTAVPGSNVKARLRTLPVSLGIGGVWCSVPVRSINTGTDTDAGATVAADDEDEDEEDDDDDAVAGLSVCGSVYPGGYWWYFRYLVGTCSMSASPKVRSLTFGGTVGPMNTLNLQVGARRGHA
jgi:hypothetical protein